MSGETDGEWQIKSKRKHSRDKDGEKEPENGGERETEGDREIIRGTVKSGTLETCPLLPPLQSGAVLTQTLDLAWALGQGARRRPR